MLANTSQSRKKV